MKSLKITWIRRIINGDEHLSWLKLLSSSLPKDFQFFFKFGLEYSKLLAKAVENSFWKDVFISFYQFRFLVDNEDNVNEPLWYNNMFKINNEMLHYMNWMNKGIFFISDLLGNDGKLLSYELFCDRYNFHPPFTLYYGMKTCIEKRKLEFDMFSLFHHQAKYPIYIRILRKNTKGSKDFYDLFIKNIYIRPKSELKWEAELQLTNDQLHWEIINLAVHTNTNDCKYKWFQYRIIHRILGTNVILQKIGIKDSDKCSFCQNFSETICHLFFYCEYSYKLWEEFKIWLYDTLEIELELDVKKYYPRFY